LSKKGFIFAFGNFPETGVGFLIEVPVFGAVLGGGDGISQQSS